MFFRDIPAEGLLSESVPVVMSCNTRSSHETGSKDCLGVRFYSPYHVSIHDDTGNLATRLWTVGSLTSYPDLVKISSLSIPLFTTDVQFPDCHGATNASVVM